MKKLLRKGKAILAFVSVFAILAVSLFTGATFTASATSDLINIESWDKVSDGVTLSDWYDDTFEEGDGTATNPYIITSAEELAYICRYGSDAGVYYKVDSTIDAFNMNNSGIDLSGDNITAAYVKEQLADVICGKVWFCDAPFKGNFDGNGVTIYGLRAGMAYYNQASYESGSKAGYAYGGLFGQVDTSTASIKNLKIKNSYFIGDTAGAVFGNTTYSGGSIPIENCVVANCYIEATNSAYDAGVLVGRCQYNGSENISDKVLIDTCLVYGNTIVNKSGNEPRLVGSMDPWHYNGTQKVQSAEHFSIRNTVAIGCAIERTASYWQKNSSLFSNCYTTEVHADENTTITTISNANAAMGVAAATNLAGLDKSVWFFNTTTYPDLRIFHNLEIKDNGDGTHSETCGCGLVGVPAAHSTVGGVCSTCGYVDPCKDGHTLESKEMVPATETSTGVMAHDYCSVCEKYFVDGKEVSASALVIPMLVSSSEYTGTPDADLLGDGTKTAPFIITSADEFAAVALGYVATKDSDGIPYYFKVADGLRSLYMNGGEEVAAMTSVEDVKNYFTTASNLKGWSYTSSSNALNKSSHFFGNFDGNGVTVYGLYSNAYYAALFPKTGKGAVIENIAIKNSYLASTSGGFVGGIVASAYDTDDKDMLGLTLKNVAVINNVITCNGTDWARGGIVYAYSQNYTVNVDGCLVYDNDASFPDVAGQEMPLFTYSNAPTIKCSFNNIVSVGHSLKGKAWWTNSIDNGMFTNVYSDRIDENGNFSNGYATAYNLVVLESEQMTGAVARDNMTGLDESVWFFNDKTYPQLRVFHDIIGESIGVDGHINEKDACCDANVIKDGTIPHTYNDYNTCEICDYTFPCVDGHNFTDIPAVEASEEAPGNIAYKHCSQCKKNYSTDAALDAPVSSALTDNEIIIPQMLPFDDWDGTYDYYFWMNNEGDGSVAAPFIIKSAEQLAAVATANLKYDANKKTSDGFDVNNYTINNGVLDTTGLHFKVRDGLTSFYMNGGEELAKLTDVKDVKDYFESNDALGWMPVNVFGGTFNGNGATVYGLYSSGYKEAGLFPKVSLVTIKNISVKNSYFVTAEGEHNNIAIGGIVGLGQYYADSTKYGTVTIRACTVANSYLCSQNADTSYGRPGAIAGNMYSNSILIRDCLVYGNELVNGSGISEDYAPGLVSYAGGGSNLIRNVVSIGTAPYTEGGNWPLYDNSKFANVYTDMAVTTEEGAPQNYKNITKLTTKEMSGTAAQENMPALDWVSAWQINENGYPTPRVVNIKDYSAGNAWSGEIAVEFPAGDGSKANPYEISAPEYLALMLNSDNEGIYYELVEDIMINDTSSVDDWKSDATQWYTSADVEAFAGYLNGNGHTVSGIYYDDIDAGDSVGLIPVKSSGDVTNVVVADSYVICNTDAFVGAVIGSVVDSAAKPIILQGVTVEDSFVVEGEAIAGGLIGKAGESVVRISNSISKATITATGRYGGLVADASAGTSIKNSISVGMSPVGEANSATFNNVYTNAHTTLTGVTVLSDAQMKGDVAAENMSGLDFEAIWTTVADDYPALAGVINTDNGIVGEVWSGNIANAYAGGDGSEETPYLIATAEQLARCVKNHAHGKHYKLIADIYLNDVDSAYWNIKVGCNEWYTSKNSNWALFKNGGSFDGDGYIVYGLYYDRTGYTEVNKGAYLGLFPTVGQSSLIQNVAMSEAYVAGSVHYYSNSEAGEWFTDSAGTIVGSFVRWDNSYKDQIPSTSESKKITIKPEIWDQMPILRNCLADHTCYVSGTYAGGLIGYGDDLYRVYDCIFTGSLKGYYTEHTGGIVGQDTANGAYYYNCVSLPQTCDRPYGGWDNADWRTNESQWCTTVEDSYYFSMYVRHNSGTKIDNPTDRIGEAAKAAMPALDWENTWMTIEDGTPIQQIFTKHHTAEQYTALSDRAFLAPYVTVSFMTDCDVVVEDLVGRMYSPITLPVISREGYTFTGWYVFDDCSIEYPLDYFPPRDLQLFAGWEPTGIIQNFENYTDTIFDYDIDQWRLNKPGAKGGYKNAYVRNGAKSMHLLDTNTDFTNMLLNYEDMLKIGQTYRMTFWVTTDVANNPDTALKLVHNTLPEYNSDNLGIEQMVVVKNLTVGEWTQYSFEFTARTPWVSISAGGNSSLYFDDIIIAAIGEDVGYDALAKYLDELDVSVRPGTVTDTSVLSPDTSENITISVLIAVILSCAVIVITSRKNLIEVIEN